MLKADSNYLAQVLNLVRTFFLTIKLPSSMKKHISAMALVILFASCLKVTEQPATESASSDLTRSEITDGTSVAAVNTTVTTESALKTAVANAKAGDIITISGTI